MRSAALADYLELWGFEGDCILFADGSMGFGLDVCPIDVTCSSDESTNSVVERIAAFLNGLPSNIHFQFIQDITSGNEKIISSHETLAGIANNEAAKSLCLSRAGRFRELDKSGKIPVHSLKLFVRRLPVQMLVNRPRLFSKKKIYQDIAEDRLTRELKSLEQLREGIRQGLNALELKTDPLTVHQVIELVYWQWNPTRPVGVGRFDPEDVRSSLLFTDTAIYEKGFALANMHHRLVSLKTMPDHTFASMASALRDLPFDSRLFLSVFVPDQTKELESLQTQRRMAFSMARGKRTGVSDIESEAKLQDLESLLEQMIAQGEKVFHVSLNVLLRSTSEDDLDEKVTQTLSVIRNLSGAEAMVESHATFPVFSELSIPNAKAKERSKRIKTSNLADLLPIYGPWQGFKKPRILLRSRMGSLVSFDPFDSGLANANQLISGGSGSGKSFLTNILLLQMLKENPRVYFVDIGGSYKKLCENLGGQYLPLGVNAGISLNPFDLAPGEEKASSGKIKFLLGLIELMAKEDHDARLPKLERAVIEEAIQKVYDTSKSPRLSDLQAILLASDDVTIRRYGRILAPWCGNTPFGRFIDAPTNIELDNSVVAFDLKDMETFPDLQAVCLFIITDLVWREVQRDRQTMKFLVLDECWKLLKNESALVFVEEVFRTFRKYHASAIAISQDIDDFAKSKISGAVLPNCSIKWLLMQQQSDSSRIQEVLGLNANELGLVKSLYQEKGSYSEAFLLAQKDRAVVVVEASPLEYWIATTDPKDLGAIERQQKEAPDQSHIETLKSLASKYPKGIAAFERGNA